MEVLVQRAPGLPVRGQQVQSAVVPVKDQRAVQVPEGTPGPLPRPPPLRAPRNPGREASGSMAPTGRSPRSPSVRW